MNEQKSKEYLESIFAINSEEKNLIEAFHNKKIAIYGAGRIGKKTYNHMQELSLEVVCFLDKSGTEGQLLYGLPVYTVEDNKISQQDRENIIVACAINTHIIEKQEVTEYLKGLGYKNVISSYRLVLLYAMGGIERPNVGKSTEDKMFSVLKLLEDEHSREIYCSNIRAHYKWEYTETLKSENMIQYFHVEVPFSKGYSSFIDVGAFTGDSLEKLAETQKCDRYIAFEPEKNNFEQLVKTADVLNKEIKEMYIFPCATSETSGFMSFTVPGATGGNLSEVGEDLVQVVKLDDVIKGSPTMIKMDIEGAEISTLKGAERLIKTVKPDLEICVYHYVSDIWEIPSMLHSWVPEYKFYLRAHESATMETVLYVTI